MSSSSHSSLATSNVSSIFLSPLRSPSTPPTKLLDTSMMRTRTSNNSASSSSSSLLKCHSFPTSSTFKNTSTTSNNSSKNTSRTKYQPLPRSPTLQRDSRRSELTNRIQRTIQSNDESFWNSLSDLPPNSNSNNNKIRTRLSLPAPSSCTSQQHKGVLADSEDTDSSFLVPPARSSSEPCLGQRATYTTTTMLRSHVSAPPAVSSNHNNLFHVQIAQRSGSKAVREAIETIQLACRNAQAQELESASASEEQQLEQHQHQLLEHLCAMLSKWATDDYYRAIITKYQGIPTLRLATTCFPDNLGLQTSCRLALELLQ